ncbi:hypothetical protein QZH41_005336 [Actinostola sp. cb2023]|nr:hypothetical protein QZH41_005336 [Actinostola sp. cb2023]
MAIPSQSHLITDNPSSIRFGRYEPPIAEKTFHILYLIITTLAIVIGNAMVIVIVRLDLRLHSPTFYFLGNLAVADLLAGVGYYGRMTKKKTRWLIAFIWIHSIFWASCPLWNWGETLFDQTTHTCRPNFAGSKKTSSKVYAVCLAIFGFAIPVLVTIYTYFRIFRVADDQSKKIAKDSTTSRSSLGDQSKPSRDLKAHKTILIIIGGFALCWLPYTIGTSFKLLTGHKHAPYWLSHLGLTLALTNSFINPVIYTIRDRRFRRGLKKFLFSKRSLGKSGHFYSRSATPSNMAALATGMNQEMCQSPKTPDRIR